jgi:pimeloyl-ACP methyl ester carboxylesterase
MEIDDTRIQTSRGKLYAKQWVPDEADGRAPMVLLHQSLGCVELWGNFPRKLAQATRRTVLAYDRLGFGQSDPHPGELDLDFIEEEAREGFAAVRKHFGIDHFIAYGHSVGAGMAAACAATYPDSCDVLITEAAQATIEQKTIDGVLEAREMYAEEENVERLRPYHGDKTEWVLHAWIDTWLADEFRDWNLYDVLARVECPTLVIHGDEDEYGSPEQAASIAQRVDGSAKTLMLDGCGHIPHRERTEEVLRAAAEFLDS